MSTFERVRLLWPDHLGLARGKYLPHRLLERGTTHCVTTFGLGYDRSMIPAPGAYLLDGLRDVVATCEPGDVRRGWEDDRTGVAVAHLAFEGSPYRFSSRFALQQAIADWADLGYRVRVGIELEAYVIEPDGAGGWQPWVTPRSFVYGTGRLADPTGLIDQIITTAATSGFRLESINAEFDAGQFELTLEHDDALAAVDDVFLFRVLAREVALANGLDLTFLGKPFNGVSGSGLHVNFSLERADKADHTRDDHARADDINAGDDRAAEPNAFVDDTAPAEHRGLSSLARQCLAGLCAHHEALVALAAPTVNAYRRLQPGELAGYWANWGHDHRMAANRVPEARGAATRIESRVGDGAANPYLATAAVLQAARLGVEHELACPEPLVEDGLETSNTDRCAGSSLREALDHLRADTDFVAAVGSEVVDNFLAVKEAEWDRYLEAVGTDEGGDRVTAWEIDEYLMYH